MPTSWQNAVTRSVSWSSASSGANAARLNAIALSIIVTPLAIDELFLMLF